ncbi:unnamed protein product [Protopolystoma xenopodis]|uniref:Uncharacterized protein n=1 Tax=Protopolystoma xenopodis TaxID=117903 RepID=A0A3S5CB83_9PLAT|nr:unnamed protein product [Protopolystoma xenopodis]
MSLELSKLHTGFLASPPFVLVFGMLIRVCHIIPQSSYRSYHSLSLAPKDPPPSFLVQVFHSIPATLSVQFEALFPAISLPFAGMLTTASLSGPLKIKIFKLDESLT